VILLNVGKSFGVAGTVDWGLELQVGPFFGGPVVGLVRDDVF